MSSRAPRYSPRGTTESGCCDPARPLQAAQETVVAKSPPTPSRRHTMSSQPIASGRPAPSPHGPARHRRIRTAAIAAVAALIATGGYLATTTTGPDATLLTPTTGTEVNPSAQTLRDMHQSIASQYGTQAVANATMQPNAQARRKLRESITGQYGPAH